MEDTKLDTLCIKFYLHREPCLCIGQQLIDMKRKIKEMVGEHIDLLQTLETSKEFVNWQFSKLGKLGLTDQIHLNKVLKRNGIDKN